MSKNNDARNAKIKVARRVIKSVAKKQKWKMSDRLLNNLSVQGGIPVVSVTRSLRNVYGDRIKVELIFSFDKTGDLDCRPYMQNVKTGVDNLDSKLVRGVALRKAISKQAHYMRIENRIGVKVHDFVNSLIA